MKRIIRISIIIVILIIISIGIFFGIKSIKKYITIKTAEKVAVETRLKMIEWEKREKELEMQLVQKDADLRKEVDLYKLTVFQKDNLIIRYKKEIEKQDKIIKEYQDISKEKGDTIKEDVLPKLEETTEALKQDTLNYGFTLYAMPGIRGIKSYITENQPIDFMLIIGIDYIKYFWNNTFGLSVGGWIQPINDIDFGLKLGVVINIKKK